MKRYHVFTDKGRKVTWALSSSDAKLKIEAHGLKVIRVIAAPNPLNDVR